MSFNKRINILIILTSVAYGIQIAIMLIGALAPDASTAFLPSPWYAWALVAVVIAYVIAATILCLVTRPKNTK